MHYKVQVKEGTVEVVWLDRLNLTGIVKMRNTTLGYVYSPIELDERNGKYYIPGDHMFPNYRRARKYIHPIVEGRLRKVNVGELRGRGKDKN